MSIYASALCAWGWLLSLLESAGDNLRAKGEMISQMSSGDYTVLFILFAISAFIGQFVVGAAAAKHKKLSKKLYNPTAPTDYVILFIGTFLSGFAMIFFLLFAVFLFLWVARGIRVSDLNRS